MGKCAENHGPSFICTGWDAAVEGSKKKVFSIAVRMCAFFEKQPRMIWKGKPAM